MEKGARINLATALILFVISIFLATLVLAAPTWKGGIEGPHNLSEDTFFTYNFSVNLTNPEEIQTYSFIEGSINITPNLFGYSGNDEFYWLFLNSTTGVMTINSTIDNQTGLISMQVLANNGTVSSGVTFYFNLTAVNDYPQFTNIQSPYNLTENIDFTEFINASDEEEHYPLLFTINFTSCDPADWSDRTSPSDCQLFNFSTTIYSDYINLSAMMNYTPVHNDVGVYYANISVMDNGENYSCSSTNCETNYQSNRTTYYSTNVTFNVFSELSINVTDCQNLVFQENQSNTCQINITAYGPSDTLNISSLATVRNYASANVTNSSWFFANNITNAVDFIKTIDINVTPQKTEIGNWSINFTVYDLTSGTNATQQIYIYVNRTNNAQVDVSDISEVTTSQDALTVINFTVQDLDFLIPDKNQGFNETLNITITAYNQSALSQTLSLRNMTALFYYYPQSGTNRTLAYLQFTPNSTETGNYTINVTATDIANSTDTVLFNLTVLANQAPTWDIVQEPVVINGTEGTEIYLNLSQNVSDPDGDALTFTFVNLTQFNGFVNGFNLTTGILNFTPTDVDIGYHNITITVTDGYLTDVIGFNFTINNTNDNPDIQSIGDPNSPIVNAEGDSTNGINISEESNATLTLWVDDDDVRIPSNQKTFYNENFTLNLTIQGPNTNLFSFIRTGSFPATSNPQRFSYDADFTPNKTDVGDYNITILITDNSSATDTLTFNLTVIEVQHFPVMSAVGNQTFSINNDTFYLDLNSTDAEDINETSPGSNLTYTLENLTTGGNFLTINSSTGVINFTFNETYAGVWTYNVSVNDSSGLVDFEIFTIKVYDYPYLDYPPVNTIFNFKENVTTQLNFSTNHTVGIILNDTLNYTLYFNGIYRNSTNGNGNGTEFLWNFTANFTDNMCDSVINFTLNVSNPQLTTSRTWNLTINQTNDDLNFVTDIQDQEAASPIALTLSTYFIDADLTDVCLSNQNITFNYTLVNGSDAISVEIVNWSNGTTPTATFTSSSTASEQFYITATEYNESGSITNIVQSNNFTINITASTTTTTTTSGGGGGGGGSSTKLEKETVSLKIIVPEPVIAKQRDSFTVPIGIFNDGKATISDISINTSVTKDSIPRTDFITSLDKTSISTLPVEEYENASLYVSIDTNDTGIFEVLISALSQDPPHLEWEIFYVQVEDEQNIKEKILFTQEFIVGNPECTELKELVDEAQRLFDKGDLVNAQKKADEALEACKRAIAQEPSTRIIQRIGDKLFGILGIASLSAFVLGFAYYYYRRIRLKRMLRGY